MASTPRILFSTAPIFTLKSIRKLILSGKALLKRTEKTPIIGLGLLLDANMIPIGMKMYPGNESEKTGDEGYHFLT